MSVLLLKYLIIKKLLKRFGCDYFTQSLILHFIINKMQAYLLATFAKSPVILITFLSVLFHV